ncbi:hypothetical protein Elgi_52720 [Paenibacillus elgii]|nr:hypothetical protein Elgi_52720 [Paenibacillus elgii]
MEIYHLSVEKCANGSETVEILNQASNGYEYRALPCGMRKSWKSPAGYFVLQRKAFFAQSKIVTGHIPHLAESFAVKYWKEKGYLRSER